MKEAERDQISSLLSAALTDPAIRRLLLQGSRHELMDEGIPQYLAGMISEARAQTIEELARSLLIIAPDLDYPRPWRAHLDGQRTAYREPVPVT